MIIENPEAFKSWLTSILEPLCDADPAALAKYVYALVKKDKPMPELRAGMVDQLDVFLQQETKPFVDMLFTSLDKNDYLNSKTENNIETPVPGEEPTENPEKEPENNNHVPAMEPIEPTNGDEPRGGRQRMVVTRPPLVRPPGGPVALPSRAPPQEQTLVKLLPTELLEEPVDHPPRKRDRRPESLRDKDDRRRRRSHSRERRVRPRRHTRDHDERPYEKRRTSPRLVSPTGRYRNRSPPPIMDRPNSRSKSPIPLRERDHRDERDRLRLSRELERDRMSRDRDHRDRMSISRERDRSRERSLERSRDLRSISPRDMLRPELGDIFKRRCIDFDEKGYCMRGDLCKYDHGTDPLVLEDAALTRVLSVPPPVPEYNPLTPDIWCGTPGFVPFPPPRHPPRELVQIPRIRHDPPPPPPPPAPRNPPPHKKSFDYNRLGLAAPRPPLPANAVNCSLEVKKVPRGMNDITHLNNHFSKFGKIVNIQVCFEGDLEAALITFSNPTEANVAYKSTEAVLNNRFIKVFWHNPENKQENLPPSQQQPKQQPDNRQQNNRQMSHNKVLINRDNIKATSESRLLEKAKEVNNPQPEPKKEVIKPAEKTKQAMDMSKRAQALLETQLQQQMLLIQKFESGKVTGPQKTVLLEAINSAQEGIEKLRKELFAYNGTVKQMQAKKAKTREEFEKEILDAELDMMTKQQEGQDVVELKKKVDDMKRQRDLQFPPHPVMRRQHSRGGGRFSTVNRYVRGGVAPQKVYSVNQSVDHRPRALLISGFESDELDALVQHFSQFGEVTNKEVNLAVPELVLQYRLRAHAELAFANGRNYNDRTLTITWSQNTKVPSAPGVPSERPAPNINGDSNDEHKEKKSTQEEVEDMLLRFDEEEEEEDLEEDRSWRR